MLNLEISKLKKYFGDRLVIDIENLKVYSEDRIGIVGDNGAGKTTLLNIIAEKTEKDEGDIKRLGSFSYISQLEDEDYVFQNSDIYMKFNLKDKSTKNLSGGEKTKFKIAKALSSSSDMLLADEPTSNLDILGAQKLEEMLLSYKGALMIVSHDRELLDAVCNNILEIEAGRVKLYEGNYSEYIKQKELELRRKKFEYGQYVKEKEKLEKAVMELSTKASSMKKAPSRMGNSEARLHRKMGNQKAKANLDKAKKALRSRIDHLEAKEKPREKEKTIIDFEAVDKLHSKVVIEGENINKAFGKRTIFRSAEFQILSGTKTALLGGNGCGKTTLLKMILDKEKIRTSSALKIGYFSQDLGILEENKTILQNVLDTSIYNEDFSRLILSRLLFKREEVYKRVSVLSGGERVKLSFAKIILMGNNILILDEPTNYLDLHSIEALEDILMEYEGTILFVSHDRKFIKKLADNIMWIEGGKINNFKGSYEEYLEFINKSKKNDNLAEEKFILENKLSEIIGKLSMPSKKDDIEELDKEYKQILKRIKEIKSKMSI